MGHDHLKTHRVVARPLSKPAEGGRDVWNRVRSPGHGDALWPLSPSPDACRLAPRLPRRWPPPCVSSSSSASHLGASELAASSHGDSLPVSGPGPSVRVPGLPGLALGLLLFGATAPRDGTRPRGSRPRRARRSGSACGRDQGPPHSPPPPRLLELRPVPASVPRGRTTRAVAPRAWRSRRDGTGRDGLRKRRCRPPPFPASACDFTAADETAGHGRFFFFFFFGFS